MLAIAEPRARPKAERFHRPLRLRDGLVFCFISQSGSCRILGFYFHRVPCGTDFLQPPTFAILIVTSYVDAHGQLPDRYRRCGTCLYYSYARLRDRYRSFDEQNESSRKNGSEILAPQRMRNRSEKFLNEILWSSVSRW